MREFQWEEKWIRGGEAEVLLRLLNERLINSKDVLPPGAGGARTTGPATHLSSEISHVHLKKLQFTVGFFFWFWVSFFPLQLASAKPWRFHLDPAKQT